MSIEDLKTLSVEQLADALGLAEWRVRELIQKGEAPPSFRVGRTYRFPIVGVRTWLAEQTNNTKEK